MNLMTAIQRAIHEYRYSTHGEPADLLVLSENLFQRLQKEFFEGQYGPIMPILREAVDHSDKICGLPVARVFNIDNLIVPIARNTFSLPEAVARPPALPGETGGVQNGHARGGNP